MKELIHIVTIVEFVFSGLAVLGYLIVVGIAALVVEAVQEEESARTSAAVTGFMIIVLIIYGIIVALNVFLAFVLHRGVKNRDQTDVNKWVTAQIVILVLALVSIFLKMFSDPAVILRALIPAAYRIWTIYVVRNFLKKLREEGPQDMEAPSSFQPMAQE